MLRKPGPDTQLTPSYFLLLVAFLVSLFSLPLHAQEHQSMDELQQQARSWIDEQLSGGQQEYTVEFRTLDPRLKLARCPEPLDFEVHGNNELRGRSNLRVSCYPEDWFIFVTAEVQVFSPVVTASTSLNRGALITEQMLEVQQMDVSRVRGEYFTSFQPLLGMQVRNRIRAGDIITSRQVNIIQAVSRGDQVIIQAKNKSLTIRMMGEALDSGSIGEQIRVRNLQSGRTVRARITARGIVEVRI
jgi:flagella basal body P-ring formation protein FlgA